MPGKSSDLSDESNEGAAGALNGSSAVADTQSARSVRELAQVFKLLSDETRLRILLFLARVGESHVTGLCERLGQSQPAVSHHLALLRVSGLIEARREGKHNYYRVRAEQFGELLGQLYDAGGQAPRKFRLDRFLISVD